MNRTGRFSGGQSGAAHVDWLVMSAAVVAFATTVGAALNAGIADLVTARFDRIISDAVDGIGRDKTDRKQEYTQGCKEPCASKSSP
ncbi:hypothetical protein [Pseudogemmobacter sonorensis]|uniref:hypothetical protein n=1 Tax=Pseudogemmobacter sonorensis TaxID=2989681 RepID=UPI00369E0193